MNHTLSWIRSIVLGILLLTTACQPIQPQATPVVAQTIETQIQNAMSAAPSAIAERATIIDWPAPAWDQLVELRAGDNGWTCFPDDPGNPVNDPMCLDKMWMVWLEAVMTGSELQYTGPVVSYMLQGGSDPSNTDPYLTQPPAGHSWNITPRTRHVRLSGQSRPRCLFDGSEFRGTL